MAGSIFVRPKAAPISSSGAPYAGAKYYFYATGTSTLQSVYTDSALTTPHANPVVADGTGTFAPIWLDPTKTYRAKLTTAAGVLLEDVDPVDTKAPSASNVTFLQSGTGAVTRYAQDKMREVVSVKDFGAVGNGIADDTAAIQAALASLTSGGALYFPKGTYKFLRGTGTLLADTISSSNVLIYGDGAASKISGYNGAGAIPNNGGNEYYNVFQATSRSNITVRDLAFDGYTTPVSLFSCNNVSLSGIVDVALLANAGGYLRDKAIYLSKCSNVRVSNCKFDNAQFAVYLGGDGTTQSRNITVTGCNFEQTAAAGSFTSLFPVGVYAYYSNDVTVVGNTFQNIYSSLDNGTTGTGMGYGVYEGDGSCNKLSVIGNTFQYDAKGSKNATGIYINQAMQVAVVGNAFRSESSGRLSSAVLVDVKLAGGDRVVSGNSIQILNTSGSWFGVYVSGTSSNVGKVRVSDNVFYGGLNAIRVDGLHNVSLDIDGNTISSTTSASIQLQGLLSSAALKFPKISNNKITASQNNGILINQYTVSAVIIGNTILDGNLSNTAGDSGAAIQFASYSHGSFIANNVIGNTPTGGGLFTYGVQNANNAVDRIFKDITFGNTFIGLNNNSQFGRYFTSSPTNGAFDINKGDFIQNAQLNAGGNPGWYCAFVLSPTLTADASNASTTVTVSSTSSMAAGQTVLLTKSNNPAAGDYASTSNWHIDTISSVTDATHFVLTTGIPVGDGTYVAGTAAVKVVSFKAAAAIAA